MTVPEELASFRRELDRLPDHLWRSIDLRLVATRINGQWHNLGARAYLDAREAQQVTRFPSLPETDDLLVIQEVREKRDVDSLLASMASGLAEIAGRPVHFQTLTKTTGGDPRPYFFGVGFSDVSNGMARDYVYWSTLYAFGHGSALADLIGAGGLPRDRFDAATRRGHTPYDGLADLERYFLAKPQPAQGNTMVGFEVFAPFQVRLSQDRSRLEGGTLTVHLEAASREFLEASSVGLFGLDGSDLPVQGSFPARELSLHEGGMWRATVTAPVGGTFFAKVMLCVGPWCVDRAVLFDLHRPGRNQRQLAYQAMDPGESLFREWLFPETPDRDDQFERAVARLFVMLGYQVDSYAGVKRLGEGVDLLAHDPFRPRLLAVECTTGAPGTAGKLGRLVARAQTLKRDLKDVEVLPVLVTALPQESIPKDEQGSAAEDDVALVSREGVEELVRALSLNTPLEGVTSIIRAMVPPKRAAVWG